MNPTKIHPPTKRNGAVSQVGGGAVMAMERWRLVHDRVNLGEDGRIQGLTGALATLTVDESAEADGTKSETGHEQPINDLILSVLPGQHFWRRVQIGNSRTRKTREQGCAQHEQQAEAPTPGCYGSFHQSELYRLVGDTHAECAAGWARWASGLNEAVRDPEMQGMPPASRMPWLDHLRTFVILLVVNLHACVTYSHVGDWYFMSEREPSLGEKVPFIFWEGTLQSFFMGLLFFVSGYLAHGSLVRKGTGAFLRERWFRLGVPALGYMLVIHPFIVVGLNPWHAKLGTPGEFYLRYLRTGRWLGSSGPLWFAVALLMFCTGLALWRRLRAVTGTAETESSIKSDTGPSTAMLLGFAGAIGVVTFMVRLVQPIGTNVLNMQLCFFAQYIAFFTAGVSAARGGWLQALAASATARRAGWVALVGGPLLLAGLILAFGTKNGIEAYFGGWSGQALGMALWEQFSGVGLSVGLLALFSRKLNYDRPGLRWLAERSFGVYLFHAPILVALAMVFRGMPALPQNPYLLAGLLTVTGLGASLIVADLARRVPGVRAAV